jgi:RNA polymerase sigma-70 factor (ECF subfamily)
VPPDASDSKDFVRGDSTFELLARARSGDDHAVDRLFTRYLPPLKRYAHGRLPQYARHAADTQDLVQETLIQVLKHIRTFESRHEGGFQSYLRQAVLNRVRNAIRDSGRRPGETGLDEAMPATESSPLEQAIGAERLEHYDAALARLRPIDREIIIAKVEMGCTYQEIATSFDLPTADAARKAAQRALLKLAEEMTRDTR